MTRTAAQLRGRVQREVARRKASERQLALEKRQYRQLRNQSRSMQDQSRTLAHRVLVAQEEERKTISRELHDEIAQLLAAVNVQLAALSETASIDTLSLQKKIAQTRQLVTQSVEVVHRFARELRPAMLDDLGLIPALRSYIRGLPGRKGLQIRFLAFSGVGALTNARRTVLYRVTQEALMNVARHANASSVTVRIRKIAEAVRLEIHDNGKSFRVDRVFAANPKHRLGLLGMRERVEMEGGVFAIESSPTSGTRVSAEFPLRRGSRFRPL